MNGSSGIYSEKHQSSSENINIYKTEPDKNYNIVSSNTFESIKNFIKDNNKSEEILEETKPSKKNQ